ncbi:hypothetical protein D3870_08725 [Noviherbaspirillum cavernae]|uniref:Uncharacterized protein n=1 Tax=Noviherbaspirillum cavernae TaxID=2320862 RepID=A0A418X0W5_9BURK|nr:hypothetical protein [Noviherbaspirillum cavernae]RJG06081.1 hypothetical protein D3870_08725 [Noviherbaspirillum cavernae]
MEILHGTLLAKYKEVEDALDFAKTVNEQQLRLKQRHTDSYNVDVHCSAIAFGLRGISRKIDALVTALQRRDNPHAARFFVSVRTAKLQEALREYNAATASVAPWEISLDATVNCLELAFGGLESIEDDIYAHEQRWQ